MNLRHLLLGLVVLAIISGGALSLDLSGDGITGYEDLQQGTSPFSTDTDGDGLSDYDEVNEYDTDPTYDDTDHDGLSDGDEIHEYGSNPNEYDTDWDRLNDGDEANRHGTDPTKSDTDGDGLPDKEELQHYDTDPTDADADDDGLLDGEEIEHNSAPTHPDSDDDGLLDGEEVHTYNTDPTKAYTVENGFNDGDSVELGLDPAQLTHARDFDKLDALFDGDITIYKERPIGDSTVPNTGTDSSGDGFSDAYSESEPNITTDEIDIFLQVSYMEGSDVPASTLLHLVNAFDDAPVTNVDGDETGINLHIYVDDEPVEHRSYIDLDTYDEHYEDDTFTTQGYGFYHVLVGDRISFAGGVTSAAYDSILVADRDSSTSQGYIIMHELGHQLGLTPNTYDKIDKQTPFDKYPSVMNYKANSICPLRDDACVTYSDGPGFDDWSYIEENLRFNHPDMSHLK